MLDELEALAVVGTVRIRRLFAELNPYPEGGRAQGAPTAEASHYPGVSHHGGLPDGS